MLRLQILGGLHITLDDEPVTGFISGKAQALLCYLAINNQRPHLRASLAAMFWGDMLDEDAATNLRQAIANLKRLLEPYFEITRQSIAFNTNAAYWLDVEEFESTHDPRLYQGDLLAGFGLPDAPDFDDWLAAEREHLHELAVTALREKAALCLAHSDDAAAIDTLNKLLALDPLHEEAHRQLMRAYVMNGQRNAALAHYDKCRDILQRELGIKPEADTTHLYERIKSAQKLTNLPSETAPLIGREQEMAEVARQLNNPACHLITIAGLGGIGKTRLVLRVAHQQAARMLHGAVMVNLSPIHTFQLFLGSLVDALPVTFSQESTPQQQILDYLREKELLLVLDNFEHLTDVASAFVSDMLRTAPELKLIITSRERLNLRGEWTLALHGLPVKPENSSPSPAIELFLETARRVRGDDLIAAQPEAHIRRICQLVDGMPLAIELAAAWTRLLTCEELADELESNLTALEATTRDGEERHRSLRAVFDHSWQLFSAQEQRVLMALAMFITGFTRDGAQQVTGASMPMLLGLTDKMLLRQVAEGRFSLHEMMRKYLLEKLAESGDMRAVEAAYASYYARFLGQRETRLKSDGQHRALQEIARDLENSHHAWDIAVAHRDVEALTAMLPALSLFHDMTATWLVGEALLRRAAPVMDSDKAACGAWLSHRALFCGRLDQIDEAQRLARQCLDMLPVEVLTHGDSVARSWMVLGNGEDAQGNVAEALRCYQRALELRMAAGDVWGSAYTYLSLASANGRAGHNAEAKAQAERGLAMCQQMGDTLLTTKFQTILAIIAAQDGDLDTAEKLHQANLAIFESLDSLEGVALTLNGLAVVAYFRQDYARAQELFSDALAMNRQLGARTWEASTLNNLAEVARDSGDLTAALHYFRQSQDVFGVIGHDQYVELLQKEIDALEQQL